MAIGDTILIPFVVQIVSRIVSPTIVQGKTICPTNANLPGNQARWDGRVAGRRSTVVRLTILQGDAARAIKLPIKRPSTTGGSRSSEFNPKLRGSIRWRMSRRLPSGRKS